MRNKLFLSVLGLMVIGSSFLSGYLFKQQTDNSKTSAGLILSKLPLIDQLTKESEVKQFKSYEEFGTFLKKLETNKAYQTGWETTTAMPLDSMTESLSEGRGESYENEGATDYSQTNIQVEGVDEADMIKTDGKYIYALSGSSVFIIDAYPAEQASVLSKIEFTSTPRDLYLNGNRLVVIGEKYETPAPYADLLPRGPTFSFVKVFDVTDPGQPAQVRSLDIEGYGTHSRMIGDELYFVSSNTKFLSTPDFPIPLVLDNDEQIQPKGEIGVYYFDTPYQSYNVTTITAVNIKDEKKQVNIQVYVLDYNQTLYVSEKNIYITYPRYVSEDTLAMEVLREVVFPRLPKEDRELIGKIENVDEEVLSAEEKLEKIERILERYGETLPVEDLEKLEEEVEIALKQKFTDITKELEKTVIHKIAIDKGAMEYQTKGEVTGHVLNQFSMNEQDEYFYIATSKNRTWSQYIDEQQSPSYSNVYVLDKELNVVGAVERLAEGETIYSVRFMQDRAYLVTFEQTDPLFVIDLSTPTAPTVLGELKIPGFSNYLHPYNEQTLIGIGKDTKLDEYGNVITLGLKVSLFDVSNVSAPKEVAAYVWESQSDSLALSDHKAFLFDREKHLLVLPVFEWGNEDESWPFNGAAVFTVDADSIKLKGKIDHRTETQVPEEFWYDQTNQVQRSLYLDSMLYTFSNRYVYMNQLSDLASVNKLELFKESDEDFIIVTDE